MMADPIFAQGGGVRTVPIASVGGQPSIPGSNPNGANPMGGSMPSGSGIVGAQGNNDLSPEHISELQNAASQGDQEAVSMLKALGIALGADAAIGTGAGLLHRAMTNRNMKPPMGTPPAMSGGPNNMTPMPGKSPDVIYPDWEHIPRNSAPVPVSGGSMARDIEASAPRPFQMQGALMEAAKAMRRVK